MRMNKRKKMTMVHAWKLKHILVRRNGVYALKVMLVSHVAYLPVLVLLSIFIKQCLWFYIGLHEGCFIQGGL